MEKSWDWRKGGSILVVKTFKILTAERVSSECSQSRYIADIFSKDIFIASSDILPIYWRYTADIYINLRCSIALLQVVQSIALFLTKNSRTIYQKMINPKWPPSITTRKIILLWKQPQIDTCYCLLSMLSGMWNDN